MAKEWLDKMLDNKIEKEAMESQGTDKQDHFERKVKAHDWINGVTELDPVAVEAEYIAKLKEEAMTLGKTAALDDVIADGVTPEETVNRDYKRDVSSLSDYVLAELLAEARAHEKQESSEMFWELKEKAKAEVASSREKAEKALLELIPDNAQLDWQKAFKEYKKNETPAEPKEKDLFKSDVPEKAHDFQHPTEEKFKLPKDPEKAIPGNGREADERKDVTAEAGVLQKDIVEGTSKEAALKTEALTPAEEGEEAVQDEARGAITPQTGAATIDENVIRESFKQMIDGAGEEVIVDLLLQYMPAEDMKSMLDDFSDSGEFTPGVEHYEHAGVPVAVAKLKSWKRASLCPVCGQSGKDLKNASKENMACAQCGITYSNEITSAASKADVIKKVAELQKTAEVNSPWAVTVDENGQEVIARVDAPTNTKESEEDKTIELQK